jgi:hypothetical protein
MPISRKKKTSRKRFNKLGGDCSAAQLADLETVCPISHELLSDIDPQYRVSINNTCYDSRELCRWLADPISQGLDAMRAPIAVDHWNDFRNNYCPQLPVRVPQPQPAQGQLGVVPIHNNAGQVIAYNNAIDNEPIYINDFLYPHVANNNNAAAAAAPANNNNNNNFNPQHQYPPGDPNDDNLGEMYDGGVSQFRKKRNLSRKSRKQMRGGMKIIVKTLLDRSYTLDVETSNTVRDVKEKIALLEHVPSERQRLILAGIQLDDDRSLADYNVQENQLLHVIFNRFPDPKPTPQPPRIV